MAKLTNTIDDIDIEKRNAELLDALKELLQVTDNAWGGAMIGKPARNKARQAIAKAEGKQ